MNEGQEEREFPDVQLQVEAEPARVLGVEGAARGHRCPPKRGAGRAHRLGRTGRLLRESPENRKRNETWN